MNHRSFVFLPISLAAYLLSACGEPANEEATSALAPPTAPTAVSTPSGPTSSVPTPTETTPVGPLASTAAAPILEPSASASAVTEPTAATPQETAPVPETPMGASGSFTPNSSIPTADAAGGSSGGDPPSAANGGAGGDFNAAGAGGTGNHAGSGQAGSGGAAGPLEEEPADGCPYAGNVQYRLNGADSWPSDVREKLSAAVEEAVGYYNCYSDLSHDLVINYRDGVPTAEGNVDGVISFGSDRDYMVVATVMHEIGHTMGVGYYPWQELIENQRWVGPAVVEYIQNLPNEQRDPDMYSQRDYITADNQHFWPYGLNQANEHQSEWSLINHVRIVALMNDDKDAYRASQ